MNENYIFQFKSDISQIDIPIKLNNPFGSFIPDIAKIAAKEFQGFISSESQKWDYDFSTQKGKMFGILVIQSENKTYSYLGTVSGKLPKNAICEKFIPSVFDISVGDFFINKGMTELTVLGNQIKKSSDQTEINTLKDIRKQKSTALQQRLFENYHFLNLSAKEQNLLEIFEQSSHGYPPAAAGECAAPKLLHYAIRHNLRPVAFAEFWWGSPIKNEEKQHTFFYPACKDKCRPILEYMLEDTELFNNRSMDIDKTK